MLGTTSATSIPKTLNNSQISKEFLKGSSKYELAKVYSISKALSQLVISYLLAGETLKEGLFTSLKETLKFLAFSLISEDMLLMELNLEGA